MSGQSLLGIVAIVAATFACAMSVQAKPTREEVIAYADECKARQVRMDMVARFGTDFSQLDLRGIDFRGHYVVRNETNLAGADFTGSDLRDANLSAAVLDGADFTDAQLDRAAFVTSRLARAKLTRASVGGAFFHGSNFEGARLDGMDFTSAKLDGVRFRNASMRQARLSGTNADSLFNDFSGADLTRAEFATARMDYAAFCGANLTSADFTRASLSYADFSDAILSGATFVDANVQYAIFRNVRGIEPAAAAALDARSERRQFERQQAMARSLVQLREMARLPVAVVAIGLSIALLTRFRGRHRRWWTVTAVIANGVAAISLLVVYGMQVAGASTTVQFNAGRSNAMALWSAWVVLWPILTLGLFAFVVLTCITLPIAAWDGWRRCVIFPILLLLATLANTMLVLVLVLSRFPDA